MLFTTQLLRKEMMNLLLGLMFLIKMNNYGVLCIQPDQPKYFTRKITPVPDKEARDRGGLDLTYYKAVNELDDKTKLRLILSTATSSELKESAVFDPASIEALLAKMFKNMSTFEHFSINTENLNVIMEYKRFNEAHANDLKKLHKYLSVEGNLEPLFEKSNFYGFLENYIFGDLEYIMNVLDRLIEDYNLDASHARWKYLSASENAALKHLLSDKLFFEYKLENVEKLTNEIKKLVLKRPDPKNSDQLTIFFRTLREEISKKCAENIKQTFKAVLNKIQKDEITFVVNEKKNKKVKFENTKLGKRVKAFFVKAQTELTQKLIEILTLNTIMLIEKIGNDNKNLKNFDANSLGQSYTTDFKAMTETIFIEGSHEMIMESFIYNLTCAKVCLSLENLYDDAVIEKPKLVDDFVDALDRRHITPEELQTIQLDDVESDVLKQVSKKLQDSADPKKEKEREQEKKFRANLNIYIKNAIATIREKVIQTHYSPLSQDEVPFIDASLDAAIKELDVTKKIEALLDELDGKEAMKPSNFIQLVCLGMSPNTTNGERSTSAAAKALAESHKEFRMIFQEVIKMFLTNIEEQSKILEANKKVLMKAIAALDQYIKVEQKSFVIEKETDEIEAKFPNLYKNDENHRLEFNKAFHRLVQQLEYTKNIYRTKTTDIVPTKEEIQKTLSDLSKEDAAYKTHLVEVQSILANHFSKENLDARKKKLDTFLTLIATIDQEDKVYPESVIIIEMINDLGNIGHENAKKIVEKMKIALKNAAAVSKLDFEQTAAANGYKGEGKLQAEDSAKKVTKNKTDGKTDVEGQDTNDDQQPNPILKEDAGENVEPVSVETQADETLTETVAEESQPEESKYDAAFYVTLALIAILAAIIGITGYCIAKHHMAATTQSI